MKYIIIITTLFFGLFSCDNQDQPNEIDLSEYVEENKIDWKKTKLIYILGKLADSTFNESDSLTNFFDFKIIDSNGIIKPATLEMAISLHNKNIKNGDSDVHPIFEIKNSSTIILPAYGKGLWGSIWGYLVVNKTTLKIINIEIDHQTETPGLGAEINKDYFENQFIGTVIDSNQVNFSLYQNEKTLIKGLQKVDGLSGATITSTRVVEMINNDLLKFKKYLW